MTDNFPELMSEWDYNKNGNLRPTDIACGSQKNVWWLCKYCHESYKSRPYYRTLSGKGCPFCSGKVVCKSNCLATKFPNISKEWHPTLNCSTTPNDIMPGSHQKVWWLCSICHESYEMTANARTNPGQKQGCPYCAGRKACDHNCLATKFPELSKEWHPTKNGKLTPKDVTCSSHKKAWWLCPDCYESYESLIKGRRNGKGCPYCAGQRVCSWNCLQTKFPDIAKQWHPTKNGNLTANDVTCGSNIGIWFVCSFCKKNTLLSCKGATARRKNTVICSDCNLYYQEELVRTTLENLTGKKFPKTRNIQWLFNDKTKRKYEADGYCEELNIIFEHQGPQHCMFKSDFNHNNGMKQFFYQLYKDAEKYRLCKENNCLLICTYYDQTGEEIEEYVRKTLIDNNVPIVLYSNQQPANAA